VDVIPAPTMEVILDRIIASKGAREVLIVCHGTMESLDIPITAGTVAKATEANIRSLANDQDREERGPNNERIKKPAISDQGVIDNTEMTVIQQVRSIRIKMNVVRAMKLKHVAFRACNLGSAPVEALQAFRDFFGAMSISAPRDYDSYAKIYPEV